MHVVFFREEAIMIVLTRGLDALLNVFVGNDVH